MQHIQTERRYTDPSLCIVSQLFWIIAILQWFLELLQRLMNSTTRVVVISSLPLPPKYPSKHSFEIMFFKIINIKLYYQYNLVVSERKYDFPPKIAYHCLWFHGITFNSDCEKFKIVWQPNVMWYWNQWMHKQNLQIDWILAFWSKNVVCCANMPAMNWIEEQ